MREPPAGGDEHDRREILLHSTAMDAGEMEEAIGALMPEARTLSARAPVGLALLPAG